MNKDEAMSELAGKVIEDIGSRNPDWQHMVLVGRFEDDEPAMNGFVYSSDGESVPVSPMDFDALDLLQELRTATAAADGSDPWLAALFRIDRSSNELNVEFEYDHPSRWTITLQNTKARAEEFRPSEP